MHLLRFSNSGIKAKVFVRKISFKLRVMRLNPIESFYAFLLHYYSERSEERRLATAIPPTRVADHRRPLAGVATHSQAGSRRRSPVEAPSRRWSPVEAVARRGATANGHNRLQRGGRLQGARKGLPPTASPTNSKGDDRRGGDPLVGAVAPTAERGQEGL
ncbi:hypothetical protein B296_00037534 [Ensete ventricosum]|uniref:Uncharacterized protein n=1 Tax=Ensete ventricosum TaxID=4639 RepID=A0A426YKC2_ENSVE|nr:hypothetical protein B296_00037534 [Ensete ventricosum]